MTSGRPPVVTLLKSNPYQPAVPSAIAMWGKNKERKGVKSLIYHCSGGYLAADSSHVNLSFLKNKGSRNMADFLCLPRHRARLRSSLTNANHGSIINVPLTAG